GKYESETYKFKWQADRALKKLQADKTTALSKLAVVPVYEGGNKPAGNFGWRKGNHPTPSPSQTPKIIGYKVVGVKLSIGLKDVGSLGSNVGGQGLAYNQKIGTA
ncbi:hypothetical protein FLW53_40600, partial [Microbispora sp. SCL1-1]